MEQKFMFFDPEDGKMLFKLIEEIKELMKKKFDQYPLSQKWLTPQQVCELLKISRRKLDYIRDLPSSKIGVKKFYKAIDIEKLLNENYK